MRRWDDLDTTVSLIAVASVIASTALGCIFYVVAKRPPYLTEKPAEVVVEYTQPPVTGK